MQRRLIPIIIGIFLMLILPITCAATAKELVISIKPVDDSVMQTTSGKFILEVINLGDEDDTLLLSTSDLKWSIQTDPLTDYTSGFYVPKYGGRTTTLLIRPSLDVKPGTNYVDIIFALKESGETRKELISVKVDKYIETQNDISISISAPDKVDPRKALSIKLNIKNNNAKEFENVKLELNSNLISKGGEINLAGFENTTAEFTVQLDDKVEPRTETVVASLIYNGETIASSSKDIEIVSFVEPFISTEETIVGFLSSKKTLTVKNDANIFRDDDFLYQTNWFVNIFSRTEPKAQVKVIRGRQYLSWSLGLRSNETTTVVVKRNFIMIPIILILIGATTFMYYTYRSPLVIKKSVRYLKKKEGGISELKIILHIKNRTVKVIKNANIIDRVPHLALIVKKEEPGTLSPDKVMKYHSGTVAKWALAQVEPHEERLITYNISSKLSILGGLSLKPAIIQFHHRDKNLKVVSNPINITMKKPVIKKEE